MIAVIDYGMGNLRSVANALEAIGKSVMVTSRPADLMTSSHIVLPGVGAFGEAIARLRELGMVDALNDAVLGAKRPFLGICLGMQLLAERSYEHGEHTGLGWIRGAVNKLQPRDKTLRVPHVGWNGLTFVRTSKVFEGVPTDSAFYFVHSYAFAVEEETAVLATCEYGDRFVAAVERENIFATQFHPEKSHQLGLLMLKNFAAQAS